MGIIVKNKKISKKKEKSNKGIIIIIIIVMITVLIRKLVMTTIVIIMIVTIEKSVSVIKRIAIKKRRRKKYRRIKIMPMNKSTMKARIIVVKVKRINVFRKQKKSNKYMNLKCINHLWICLTSIIYFNTIYHLKLINYTCNPIK